MNGQCPQAIAQPGVRSVRSPKGTHVTSKRTNHCHLARRPIVVCLGLIAVAAGVVIAQEQFAVRPYKLKHYDFKTDVPEPLADEACVRVEQMLAEFQRRSSKLRNRYKEPLPFWLFSDPGDYSRAGGRPGTSGIYTEEAGVIALAAGDPDRIWSTLQGVCFSQYAHRMIGYYMPLWVNKGLQQYFILGQWTGDRFVVGFTPASKVSGIQAMIESRELIPFDELTRMEFPQWQEMMMTPGKMDVVDLQCWSMVHFLVYAGDGKYAAGLDRHLVDVNAVRKDRIEAFNKFIRTQQDAYEQWWMARSPEPTMGTLDPQYETVARTMTAFFARASSRGQTFETAEAFLDLAKKHELNVPAHGEPGWLPWSLIDRNVRRLTDLNDLAKTYDSAEPAVWFIDSSHSPPRLILTRADGTTFTGQYRLSRGRLKAISVTIDKPEE